DRLAGDRVDQPALDGDLAGQLDAQIVEVLAGFELDVELGRALAGRDHQLVLAGRELVQREHTVAAKELILAVEPGAAIAGLHGEALRRAATSEHDLAGDPPGLDDRQDRVGAPDRDALEQRLAAAFAVGSDQVAAIRELAKFK